MNAFSVKRPPVFRLNIRIAIIALLFGALVPQRSRADERVRRVQEELRKRNLYFGEVDGRDTGEIHEAMRRYQQRKGFSPTGAFEQDAVRSLGVQSPEPTPVSEADSLPEVPILKSDSAREISEKDRAFLEGLEADPPPDLAEVAEGPKDLPSKATPPPLPPGSATPLPSRDSSGPFGTASAPPPNTGSQPDASGIERFIREYLDACQTNELPREMAFYADKMCYFDQGKVNRDFVEKDVKRYYKRWPHRDYTLLSVKVAPCGNSPAEFVARFRIRYNLTNEKARACGQTDNVFVVKSEGGHLKFTSLQEARVHS